MNRHNRPLQQAVLVVVLCVMIPTHPGRAAKAQETGRVFLEADSVATSLVAGRMVSELVNARFSQGTTELHADRARDEGNDLVLFRGNVVIVEAADSVFADQVRYDRKTGIGLAEGNVVLTDGNVRLSAPSARHHTLTGETFFSETVRFEDSLGVLLAERGLFSKRSDRAHFAGRVWLERSDVRIGADSLSVLPGADTAWATGRVGVVLVDTAGTDTARIFADSLHRDGSTGVTNVVGRILVARFEAEPPDTLLIAAERARFGGARMTAVDSVVVANESGALRSDSMIVIDAEPGIRNREQRFFGGVQAWYEGVQVTSDSLLATSHDDSGVPGAGSVTDSLKAYGQVFVARQAAGAGGRIDQMKGRFLEAVTREGDLSSMRLFPNAEVILYVHDAESERMLAFDALSDTVFVAFEGGEPSEVLFLGETAGTEYTENLFEQVRDLPGYLWVPQRRPDRERLRDRMRGLAAERIDGRKRQE